MGRDREANTSQDSYAGTGVYRLAGSSWQRVGDDSSANNPLVTRTVYQLVFDPHGNAYAATNNGLFRYSKTSASWSEVLDPEGTNPSSPYYNHVTSVQVVPGRAGRDVIPVVGWRGPGFTQDNGFYQFTDGGQTFSKVTPTGDINAADIGRTTFAYSADGTKLYAVVESPAALTAGKESVLQGVFVSSGSPASVAGPWTKIADEAKLPASGSALPVGSGYGVGVQAWYNQTDAVSPTNPNQVYLGLEEVAGHLGQPARVPVRRPGHPGWSAGAGHGSGHVHRSGRPGRRHELVPARLRPAQRPASTT